MDETWHARALAEVKERARLDRGLMTAVEWMANEDPRSVSKEGLHAIFDAGISVALSWTEGEMGQGENGDRPIKSYTLNPEAAGMVERMAKGRGTSSSRRRP